MGIITASVDNTGIELPMIGGIPVYPIFGGTVPAVDRPLCIPDVTGLTPLRAALAYALAGWYVLPTDPADIKNPGSIVRGRWHEHSSRDTAQIRRWWAEHPDAGIALHVGRSGAVAFDLDRDDPDTLPDELWTGLQRGQEQRTRRGESVRGHCVFAAQPGEFGNSAGGFMRYGDVRGRNGVIIAEPTPHADGGCYRWTGPGPVPALPDELRELLSAAVDHADPKTPAELVTFLDAHSGDDRPHALKGQLTDFANKIAEGASRHNAMCAALVWAFREVIAGCYPARRAYDELATAFAEAKPEAGPGEFDRMAQWAAAQAENADPAETLARLDREPAKIDEEPFWTARDVLRDVRQFARARRVGPWAMLGYVLARVVAAIPPTVVLPPLVGSHASVNLFVALVGPSGAGKGGASGAAADWLTTDPPTFAATLGSGEGMAKVFAHKRRAGGNTGPWMQDGLRASVLFDAPEVDNLTALTTRNSSTLLPQLRSAYSGEELGFSYADQAKAVRLCAHRYRLCLTLGVQPGRGKALLDDADGGTPQRFVWLPADDADAPDELPELPARLDLRRWPDQTVAGRVLIGAAPETLLDTPITPAALRVLGVPDAARAVIDRHRVAMLRGSGVDPLDGHRLLCRLKVAAALMFLDGRTNEITGHDWFLAGIVMAVSDRTRRGVADVLRSKADAENVSRGRAEGVRADAADQVRIDKAVQRVLDNMVRKLKASGGEMARSALRKTLPSRDRALFDDAENTLLDVGHIDKVPSDNSGPDGVILRLTEGASK
jgi:hypothetical protein